MSDHHVSTRLSWVTKKSNPLYHTHAFLLTYAHTLNSPGNLADLFNTSCIMADDTSHLTLPVARPPRTRQVVLRLGARSLRSSSCRATPSENRVLMK